MTHEVEMKWLVFAMKIAAANPTATSTLYIVLGTGHRVGRRARCSGLLRYCQAGYGASDLDRAGLLHSFGLERASGRVRRRRSEYTSGWATEKGASGFWDAKLPSLSKGQTTEVYAGIEAA